MRRTASDANPVGDERSHRRLRVSVRVMMLVVLLFGLWLGWRVHKARRQREAVEAVQRHGGWVHYDYEFVNGKYTPGRHPRAPHWLQRLVGAEFFRRIYEVSFVYDDRTGKRFENKYDQPCDDALAALARDAGVRVLMLHGHQATDRGFRSIGSLPELENLFIWAGWDVTDAGVASLAGLKNIKLVHISKFKHRASDGPVISKLTDDSLETLGCLLTLEELSLQGNHFSDVGLARLARLKRLKYLWVGLGASEITDAGLVHLEGLKELQVLDIQQSKVTDHGLEHLKRLPKLREIVSGGSAVTENGRKALRKSLPGLTSFR